MKNPYRISLASFVFPLVAAAVQLSFFVRLQFMGPRKKTRFLAKALFQHAHCRHT